MRVIVTSHSIAAAKANMKAVIALIPEEMIESKTATSAKLTDGTIITALIGDGFRGQTADVVFTDYLTEATALELKLVTQPVGGYIVTSPSIQAWADTILKKHEPISNTP